MNGTLIKAIAGFYYVSCDDEIYECKARGNFRKTGISPVVGDKVEITVTQSLCGVIKNVMPRKNLLIRPSVANIDKLFIVSAFENPAPDTFMIDRLTAIAVYKGIEPIILFNKSDMGSFSDFYHIYNQAGFKTMVVSAIKNEGLEQIKDEIAGCTCAFSGNSGVGKSSILNSLFPQLNLKTGEVSEKLGRGRHTTRHTELFAVEDGGFVVDTPGFATLEFDNNIYDFKLNLENSFPDFAEFLQGCQFTGCTHTCEKGCAVIEALKNGKIQPTRHESYVALVQELKDVKEWHNRNKR